MPCQPCGPSPTCSIARSIGCGRLPRRRFRKNSATAAIFANVRLTNAQVYADPAILRISMATRATVHVGAYSRRGQSRGRIAIAVWDHDMRPKEKMCLEAFWSR